MNEKERFTLPAYLIMNFYIIDFYFRHGNSYI